MGFGLVSGLGLELELESGLGLGLVLGFRDRNLIRVMDGMFRVEDVVRLQVMFG